MCLEAKRIPWFVSDVTPRDLEWTLDAMAAAGGALAGLSGACRALLASGRWRLATVGG